MTLKVSVEKPVRKPRVSKTAKITDPVDKAKDFINTRQQAYQATFNLESVYAKRVLEDLERFCRGNSSAFHQDPRVHAALEGRREVWLRIQHHLNLEPDDLFERYTQGGD